jgi:hypothetical protein
MEDPNADVGPTLIERTTLQERAAVAASAAYASIPHGGCPDAAAAAAAAAAAPSPSLHNLRISPCVPVGFAAPVFASSQGADAKKGVIRGRGPRRGAGQMVPNTEGEAQGVWAERQRKTCRMQGDVGQDLFDQFAEDVEVLYADTIAAEDVADAAIAAAAEQ